MKQLSGLATGLSLSAALSLAAPSIQYQAGRRLWVLEGGGVSYVLGINERNQLQHVYWGKAIPDASDWTSVHSLPQWDGVDPSTTNTPEEYPGWGGLRYFAPCLKAVLGGGVRNVVFEYASHEIRGPELTIRLTEPGKRLAVELSYRISDSGIIRKDATVRNTSDKPVVIESFQSGAWQLPARDGYRLTYLTGRWAEETLLNQMPIRRGSMILESRRGSTSNQASPWFAIDGPRLASEENGEVWFGALGWSGNWKIAVEQTPSYALRVTGGMNDFDFAYTLAPGEQLKTPPYYGGYSDHGFGGASRLLHRFELNEILPRSSASRLRPVLYNSWEATHFDVDEPGQTALARKAASIGVERFVMDDGWFGSRDSSRAGLGDWTPSSKKFPNGLKPLIEQVKSLGMDFGLWVEPEMVNPDSNLYRAHPDWVLHFPDTPRSEARNQLVLNMSRPDVKEYVFSQLDKLVSENDIAFLKWDLNRGFGEPGWPDAPDGDQRRIWVQHVRNVYEIIDRLRARHPALEIESCASGGGRVDLGILERVEQVWPSDNTDAFDRLSIQYGFTQAYAPKLMMAWVTDVPTMNQRSTPLEYRFLVAMTGSLGIGSNLLKWSDAEMATAARLVSFYKTVRSTVQQGNLYRLTAPGGSPLTASQYVATDGRQAVLFAFAHATQYGRAAHNIRFVALDANARYRLRQEGTAIENLPQTLSGAYLMNEGLTLNLPGEYAAAAIVLDRVDQ